MTSQSRRTEMLHDLKQQIATTLAVIKSNTEECDQHDIVVAKVFPGTRTMLRLLEDENVTILGGPKTASPDSDDIQVWLTATEQRLTSWNKGQNILTAVPSYGRCTGQAIVPEEAAR